MRPHDSLDDGEPKAHPVRATRRASLYPVEAVEDEGQRLSRDALTRVLYLQVVR